MLSHCHTITLSHDKVTFVYSAFKLFSLPILVECATTRPNDNPTKSGRLKPTRLNDNSTKYQLDQRTTRPKDNSTKRQVDQTTTRPKDNLTKFQLDQTTSRPKPTQPKLYFQMSNTAGCVLRSATVGETFISPLLLAAESSS
jgi:hypothetical protein